MRNWVFLGLAVGLLSSCGRVNYDGEEGTYIKVNLSGDRLAGPDTMATLDELEPGTEGVTLREAIVIANNSPEKNIIVFDRNVFKPGAGTRIVLDSDLPKIVGDNLTIEARGADVTLYNSDMPIVFDIEANDIVIGGLHFVTTVLCGVPMIDITGGERILIEGNSFNAPGNAIIATNTIELSLVSNIVATGIGFTVYNSGGVDVRGNVFTNLENRGIGIFDSSTVRVRENTMVSGLSDQIVITDASNVYVEANEIIFNEDETSQKGVRFLRVADSYIRDNFINPGADDLISLQDSTGNHIEANILHRGDAGVALRGASSDNMVFRNIIVGSSSDGVFVASSALNNTIAHNSIHEVATPLAFEDETAVIVGNNLVTGASFAGFVDAENNDFRLVKGDANVDAGELLGFDCVPGSAELYMGAAPDLGAIESR